MLNKRTVLETQSHRAPSNLILFYFFCHVRFSYMYGVGGSHPRCDHQRRTAGAFLSDCNTLFVTYKTGLILFLSFFHLRVSCVKTQEQSCSSDSRNRRKLSGTTGHRLLETQRPQMLWLIAWVWFSLKVLCSY